MEQIELNILREIEAYHKGKSNAISYKKLAELFEMNERLARKVVENLIRVYNHPICSSYSSTCGGYYWPETAEEIEENYEHLKKHALNILARAAAVKRIALEELLGQLKLGLKT